MSLDLTKIIAEADLRIPNPFDTTSKVDWLNEVNYEYFDIVKIPKTFSRLVDANTGLSIGFTLPVDARGKNIRKVVAGSSYYQSIVYEDISTAHNYYTVDDVTQTLTLTPPPPAGNLVVVYNQMGVNPFLATQLTVSPDAPPEYHWIYVLGLCARIAKAMNDVTLANNYEAEYKANLSVAQQNYARG
jgi:hypothetical protein